jgi:hypothetical protein
MRQLLSFIFITLLVLFQSFSGCVDLDDTFHFFDKELRRAEPYLKNIVFDDETLRSYAFSICDQCEEEDKESVITILYRHIVEEFSYIPDPLDEEIIRSPQQTIQMKGGDCEDLSILLMSLLENLDIKTYLVLTDEHAYALAFDINISNLWQYVEQELIQQVEMDSGETLWQTYHETFTLKRKQVWYYGGEGTSLDESESFDYLNLSYNITSSRPIDMYVVPSKQDFTDFTEKNDFTYYDKHEYFEETEMQGTCGYMKKQGGILLSNSNWFNTEVSVNLSFYSHPSFYKLFENNTIRSYMIQGKQSIVLEPTAGVYGYPGYDANVTGKKTAIDPITKEYFYLT